MANLIKLKRSAVAGKAPTTSDLELGELALNTYDGKLYTKKDNGSASIVELSGGGGAITDGTKGDITVSSSGATWSLVSIAGDVSNSGTGYFDLPSGTTAQRPGSPNTGMIRYNSTLGCVESYVQSAWQVIANTALDYGLITSASSTTFDYGALS
jgi:hypothetical protein